MKYLIFDFDGTLVDSIQSSIEAYNSLASEYDLRPIDLDEVAQLKELSCWDLIKHLDISLFKLPILLYKARKRINNKMQQILPILNIKETLIKLKTHDFNLGILTSNSIDNVSKWLLHNNMQHIFNFIHSESNLFGKRHGLQKILQANKIQTNDAFYICDETRDIEAAKQVNITSIAVTWGYNSEHVLAKYKPTHMVRSPDELLDLLT